MTNTKHTSVIEVGLIAFLVLAAIVVALVATDGPAGPAAGTSGAAIGQTNTVAGE